MIKYISWIIIGISISLWSFVWAQYDGFLNQLQTMGINTTDMNQQESVSRYELARLLNAVECKDCIHPPWDYLDRYTNPFRSEFTQLPGKDFNDISYLGWMRESESYYYCVAYVWDNEYMRWYPSNTSPICDGLFCGFRNTSYAEFLQVVINILAKYIYTSYSVNRDTILTWMDGLEEWSYEERTLDQNDKERIETNAERCDTESCQLLSAQELKTYMKYCMFNLQACNMRTFWSIGQAYWPVAELNILSQQNIFSEQETENLNIYANVDGKTVLEVFHRLYWQIDCSFNNDYDCDWILNAQDSCPNHYSPSQTDTDNDNIWDVCDPDIDGDGISNPIGIVDNKWNIDISKRDSEVDNCLFIPNPEQEIQTWEIFGDLCREWIEQVAMMIAPERIQWSSPLELNIQALTRWPVTDIVRDMGDWKLREWEQINHTYTNPGIYNITAQAQWPQNTAIAKTTVIVWVENKNKHSLQIQASPTTATAPANITLSTESNGDIDQIVRDFGDGSTTTRTNSQSFTRQFSTAWTRTITAQAKKNNQTVAVASTTIWVGANTVAITLRTTQTQINTNQTIGIQTDILGINPNTIQEIQRDFGDGRVVRNKNLIMTHSYTKYGQHVIIQTIRLQNGTQYQNFLTVFVDEPHLYQTYTAQLAASSLAQPTNQNITFTRTNLGNTISNIQRWIQQFQPSDSQKVQAIQEQLTRTKNYSSPWIYYPSNTIKINQCQTIQTQATIIITESDKCMEIVKNWTQWDYCDMNENGIPDICDPDIDGDWVPNLIWLITTDNLDCSITVENTNQGLIREQYIWSCQLDNCPFDENANQFDLNRNGIGDVCNDNSRVWNQNSDILNDQEQDSDWDWIPDIYDLCPYIRWDSVNWCPSIWEEITCPAYPQNDIVWEDLEIPRCPLNTTLCADNLCHEICDDFWGERPSDNDNICDPLESCNDAACMGLQDRCQAWLICGVNNNGNNVCIDDPTPGGIIDQEPIDPRNSNCLASNIADCISLPPISINECNQCPCQFADFAWSFVQNDLIRANLRDITQDILFKRSAEVSPTNF